MLGRQSVCNLRVAIVDAHQPDTGEITQDPNVMSPERAGADDSQQQLRWGRVSQSRLPGFGRRREGL